MRSFCFVLLLACSGSETKPEGVAEGFLGHLARGQGQQANELLCQRDRQRIAAMGSRLGVDPVAMMSKLVPRAATSFTVEAQGLEGSQARVLVKASGGMEFPLSLRRNGKSWCVELPNPMKP